MGRAVVRSKSLLQSVYHFTCKRGTKIQTFKAEPSIIYRNNNMERNKKHATSERKIRKAAHVHIRQMFVLLIAAKTILPRPTRDSHHPL